MTIENPAPTLKDWLNMPPFPDRRTPDDPLAAFVDARRIGEVEEAPMVKLDFSVEVLGGLAMVTATRTYVNKTEKPIEALLSIPVPVQAAFFGLSAVIGGKRYDAKAQSKDEARETYEGAIDEGKAAVLHEELLRGVHLLSVGNLGPGQTADVTSHWTEALRFHKDTGLLRIPLTVGEVYGVTPLDDVDDLEIGGPSPEVSLRIKHDAETVELASGVVESEEGEALFGKVPADAPIELKFLNPGARALAGVAADGRRVELRIAREEGIAGSLNAAFLVDRSGSMSSYVQGEGGEEESKHRAVARTLMGLVSRLNPDDCLSLWQFDDDCERVGRRYQKESPGHFAAAIRKLGGPRGGTSIGSALRKVIQSEEGKDILLITDGLSYDLDVNRLAAAGHRIFVVLVGEDSLEAMVGHLAVLTGGDVRYSFGSDLGHALLACVAGMRQKRAADAICNIDADGRPLKVRTARCNAVIDADWTSVAESSEVGQGFGRAVAAYAASVAFAGADESQAASIAVSEGLATHLTSLVLVAEDMTPAEGLPKTIKQRLPDPRTYRHSHQARVAYSHPPRAMAAQSLTASASPPGLPAPPDMDFDLSFDTRAFGREKTPGRILDWERIERLGKMLDWSTHGSELAEGETGNIPVHLALRISHYAALLDPIADEFGASSTEVIIALSALAVSEMSRQAARAYRRMVKRMDGKKIEEYSELLRQLA